MDDVFLTTEFNPAAPKWGTRTAYRLTANHLAAHVTWQSALRARLPPGSDVRLDMPFNGNGVLEFVNAAAFPALNVDDRSCLDLPAYVEQGCDCWRTGTAACPLTETTFCRNCTKDWAKPLGSGNNRVAPGAKDTYKAWSQRTIINRDALAAAVIRNTSGVASAFTWSHHTFTHENLDNATLYDADAQLFLNIRMAVRLMRECVCAQGWA